MELNNRFRRLARKVQRLLLQHGFVCKGQTFWWERDRLSPTIILVRSTWNTREQCDFWFDLGVFIPELRAIVYGKNPPAYPREGCLAISLRIDKIPFYPRRRETLMWELKQGDPAEADEQLWTEVCQHLEEYAVPFLDQFHGLPDAIEFLEWLRIHRDEWFKFSQIQPFEAWLPIHLAVLYWLVGDREKSLREIEAFEWEETTWYIREHMERVRRHILGSF